MILENKTIYEAIKHGARSVIQNKDILNDYNVFPVYDKDTGNNLSALMKAIMDKSILGTTIDETLESVADAALIGSRGNSGLIFSQFLYGLTKRLDVYESNIEYIRRIEAGVNYAYLALNHPVEGTMITLMRKLKNYLKDVSHETNNTDALLRDVKIVLKDALDQTKSELEILDKHNVVDAGALGFVIFVEGFIEGLLNNESLIIESKSSADGDIISDDNHEVDLSYRYCTELLITSHMNKSEIRDLIKSYGDSLVIGESTKYKKIHIHTNKPEKVIECLKLHGQIHETKVDDMFKQQQAINDTSNDIVILTDSIADLPKTTIDNHNVHVIPAGIHLDGMDYFDKLTLTNQQLFEYIKDSKAYPTSFTPSIKVIETYIHFLLKHYKKIIIVTVSSKMSGIYSVFNKALEGYKDKDILLIDTKQNSVSEGLVVDKIVEWIHNGQSFEYIKDNYQDLLKRTQILVHVDTLDNMVRSGRIRKTLGIVGKILGLKPVVSINDKGEGVVLAKSIGQKNNIKKIIRMLDKINKQQKIEKYAIVHVSNLKLAEKIKTEMIKITGKLPAYIGEISSIIAMNSGIGSVAVGVIRKE